ncbi:hypothetical protein D3C81_882030 [compost metagenome]
MRVDGHGHLPKRGVQHHVGGLAANSGQGFQRFTGFRHLAAMLLDQQATGFDDVFRLAVVQADGLDVFGQAFNAQGVDRFRGIGDRIQFGRGLVHADIGGLGREDYRNQQFERIGVGQLGFRLGVVFVQPAKDFQAFGGIHGVKAFLDDVKGPASGEPGYTRPVTGPEALAHPATGWPGADWQIRPATVA